MVNTIKTLNFSIIIITTTTINKNNNSVVVVIIIITTNTAVSYQVATTHKNSQRNNCYLCL